jgi:hypothetical protein
MAKKTTKAKRQRKARTKRFVTREKITIPSESIRVAVQEMLDAVKDVKTKIEKLPPARRKEEPNKSSLARALRSVDQLEALQLLVRGAVCCDVQIQNCEFEIEP